jgi:hypothetical protein
MIYLVIKNDPKFKQQEEQEEEGEGYKPGKKKKGFFSTASYENINYNMIGGINRGDIIEKNARRRIYDRDEDDDVSDGDLDDEVNFVLRFLLNVIRWKMNIAGNIVRGILRRWVKVKRKDVVVEIHMEDFDSI